MVKKYLQFNLKTKMRNLDLKRFCVQEMNAMEILEIDGGGLWKDIKDLFVDIMMQYFVLNK